MKVWVVINLETGNYCRDEAGNQFWYTEPEANRVHNRLGYANVATVVEQVSIFPGA